LPEVLDDYITPENPVRFIDAFVAQLDLAAQDFKTIAEFRKDNGQGIKSVCREFTLLCRRLDLFGGEVVAVDSTKIKAQNAKHRNYSAAKLQALMSDIDNKVSAYLGELDQADRQEDEHGAGEATPDAGELKKKIAQLQARRAEYQQLSSALEASGATQVWLTDPDSRRDEHGPGFHDWLQRADGCRCQAQPGAGHGDYQHHQRPQCAGHHGDQSSGSIGQERRENRCG
jgi:hypothetical protein